MKAFGLIPVQYRVLAGLVALLVLLVGAGAAGAMVNGWRLDAGHQRALALKDKEYEDLSERMREQNRGIAALAAATTAAAERRQVAETYAAGLLKRVEDKAQAVANSKETTCKGVLQEAWGNWK